MVAMTSVFVPKEKFVSKFGFFDELLKIKEDEELIFRCKKHKFLISNNCLVKHNPEKIYNKMYLIIFLTL